MTYNYYENEQRLKLWRYKDNVRRWKSEMLEVAKQLQHTKNQRLENRLNALKSNIAFAELQIRKLNKMGIQ